MTVLPEYYIRLGLLISFIDVILCLTYNVNGATAISRPRAISRNFSFLHNQASVHQSSGIQHFQNQSFNSEELCMLDTCGTACATGADNNTSSLAASIAKNVSSENSSVKGHQVRRYLVEDPDDHAAYVASLSKIISIDENWLDISRVAGTKATMGHFTYGSSKGRYAFASGIKGMWGCTSVVIASNLGVFLSHIWEVPAFKKRDGTPQPEGYLLAYTYNTLSRGDLDDQGDELVGFKALTGLGQILNFQRKPIIFIITPLATQRDKELGIEGDLRYGAQVEKLAKVLQDNIGSSESPHILGYNRTNKRASQDDDLAAGRVIVEVDQDYSMKRGRGGHAGRIRGSWRLWVEDRMEFEQHYSRPASSDT